MSKLSRIINKQLLETFLSSSSLPSSPVKLFDVTKAPLKIPNFLTPVISSSINLTPKQGLLLSNTRVNNLSFNFHRRCFCSNSSPHMEIEVNQKDLSSEEITDSIEKDHLWVSIPVRAYYNFNRIDLKGLMAENQDNVIPHTSEETNYAIFKFSNGSSQIPSRDSEAKLSGSSHSYVVVFPYGSTLMFNMLDDEVDGHLKIIERHASGKWNCGLTTRANSYILVIALLGLWLWFSKNISLIICHLPNMSFKYLLQLNSNSLVAHSLIVIYRKVDVLMSIEYEVREISNLHMWMQGGQGCLMLQHLDIDGIRVISSVLGQSIALNYYVRKVDGVIAAFTKLPRGRRTIRSYIMRKKRMYQLVGRANSILAELFVKLEFLERSEIAFMEDPNYSRMLDYLKDQFEFNQKIAGLDLYLRLMERFVAFVGADVIWGYLRLGNVLVVICAGLVYFFSPFTDSLYSLFDSIMAKSNTVEVTY